MKKLINIILLVSLIFTFNNLINNYITDKYETQLEGLGTKEEIIIANKKQIDVNEMKTKNVVFLAIILMLILVFNYRNIIRNLK